MEWRDRRHSFVDVLERVTDGVHVAFVDRSARRRPERSHQTDERPPTTHRQTPRDRRTHHS